MNEWDPLSQKKVASCSNHTVGGKGLPEHLSTLNQQANKFHLAQLPSLGAETRVIS